ncbi:hypothetical protein RFI_19070, partial [Reticulomyxa filosa]
PIVNAGADVHTGDDHDANVNADADANANSTNVANKEKYIHIYKQYKKKKLAHAKNEISYGGVNELFVSAGMDSLFDNQIKHSSTSTSQVPISPQEPNKTNGDPDLEKVSFFFFAKTGWQCLCQKIINNNNNNNNGNIFFEEDDDTESITSAPEEDYFAIRAYYDLETDGWDSRRSSYITGDYGRIVSRRVSKRLSQHPTNKEMMEIFDINNIAPLRTKSFIVNQ